MPTVTDVPPTARRVSCPTFMALSRMAEMFWSPVAPVDRGHRTAVRLRSMTQGSDAEHFVQQRVRAALPAEYRLYPNAQWTGPKRAGGPALDGEADLVIAHADLGLLVLEVKSGEPVRDGSGRWWLGPILLDRSPFEQARVNKYDLLRKLRALPDWPLDGEPYAGHAVCFPEVDLASLPPGHALLGADAPREIVLDAQVLETVDATRRWVEQTFDYWRGDGTKGGPLDEDGMRLVDELLAPTLHLHRLLRGRIRDDRATLFTADQQQRLILNRARALRRVEVVGPAGSGKSMLAAEQARRLAREGYRVAARLLQPAPCDERSCASSPARRLRPAWT